MGAVATERLEVRLTPRQDKLIKRAAEVVGTPVSRFLVEAANDFIGYYTLSAFSVPLRSLPPVACCIAWPPCVLLTKNRPSGDINRLLTA